MKNETGRREDPLHFSPPRTKRVPAVMREARADGVYTAVRIVPEWKQLGGGQEAAFATRVSARRFAVIVDTSRSSLEGRKLADHVPDLRAIKRS